MSQYIVSYTPCPSKSSVHFPTLPTRPFKHRNMRQAIKLQSSLCNFFHTLLLPLTWVLIVSSGSIPTCPQSMFFLDSKTTKFYPIQTKILVCNPYFNISWHLNMASGNGQGDRGSIPGRASIFSSSSRVHRPHHLLGRPTPSSFPKRKATVAQNCPPNASLPAS